MRKIGASFPSAQCILLYHSITKSLSYGSNMISLLPFPIMFYVTSIIVILILKSSAIIWNTIRLVIFLFINPQKNHLLPWSGILYFFFSYSLLALITFMILSILAIYIRTFQKSSLFVISFFLFRFSIITVWISR